MKFIKQIFAVLCILIGLFLIKTYQPSIKAVYPEQCSFLIDEQLSLRFQNQLKLYILDKYHVDKNPWGIVDDVITKFPEIISMDAYICKINQMCFTINVAKPLFVLNNEIVDSNLHLIQKDHYQDDVLNNLYDIKASDGFLLHDIVQFMNVVPLKIFQEFDVMWESAVVILLQAKNKKQEQLLFSMQNMPSEENIAIFKTLQEKTLHNKKRGKFFDFRFNNQVIVK